MILEVQYHSDLEGRAGFDLIDWGVRSLFRVPRQDETRYSLGDLSAIRSADPQVLAWSLGNWQTVENSALRRQALAEKGFPPDLAVCHWNLLLRFSPREQALVHVRNGCWVFGFDWRKEALWRRAAHLTQEGDTLGFWVEGTTPAQALLKAQRFLAGRVWCGFKGPTAGLVKGLPSWRRLWLADSLDPRPAPPGWVGFTPSMIPVVTERVRYVGWKGVSGKRYDPRDYGADCDHCPSYKPGLNRDGSPRWKPVPPEYHAGAQVAFVGLYPTSLEQDAEHPMADLKGGSHLLFDRRRGLGSASGLSRKRGILTNVTLCPWDKDYRMEEALRRAANRAKEKEEKEAGIPVEKRTPPVPSPIECCAPRLEHDLSHVRNVVAMGALPVQFFWPGASVKKTFGMLAEAPGGWRVVPVYNPSHVARNGALKRGTAAALSRAARWFKGSLRWDPPKMIYRPSPEEFWEILQGWQARCLSDPNPLVRYAVDLETDSIESLYARLRMVQLGDRHSVVVIPFLSTDGQTRFYEGEEFYKIAKMLLWALCSSQSKIRWVGQNWNYYDVMVWERWAYRTFGPRSTNVPPDPRDIMAYWLPKLPREEYWTPWKVEPVESIDFSLARHAV